MAEIHPMYINGEWVKPKKSYDLFNPANGDLIGKIADGGIEEVQAAIHAAQTAFPLWSSLPAKERGRLLAQAEKNMLERQDEISRLITLENGKPLQEAKWEVGFSAGYLSWFAEEGRRAYGETIPSPFSHKRLATYLQPVGVIGAITPWNFPANMITRKIAPALAAGCTVVLKPADLTPLTALAIARALHDAKIPKGVFNIVTAKDPRPISNEFFTNPAVRMIGFTGSTAVGKMLMAESSKQLKRLSLELGGNAPVIVFEDADVDKAVERVFAIKFLRVGGESCICANRIYIQESIYTKFVSKLSEKIKQVKVGNGMERGVQIGPLISQAALKRIDALIQDTKKLGGKITLGGHPLTEGAYAKGFFFAPTLIEGTKDEWPICQNEIFGPIANVLSFQTEKEILPRANNTHYGLAAYLFTKDLARAARVSEALRYGYVSINDGDGYTHEIPVGGYKESGVGREGGIAGLREYMEIKSILTNLE